MKPFLKMCRLILMIVVVVGSNIARSDDVKRAEILIADFEGETYVGWKTTGEAFGPGPASGTLPNQMTVEGYKGKRLVNSFHKGDASIGTLTSATFKVERKFINFLIGGGGWANETCMNLMVDGKVVRTATGPNTISGGDETLTPASWDVTEYADRKATIQIVDERKGDWGHINVDHIVQSDTKVAAPVLVALKKILRVDGTHLIVPVSNSAKTSLLGIYDGEKLIQSFTVALPQDDDPFWLAAYPLDHFGLKAKEIAVATVDAAKFPESCKAAFDRIKIGTAADAVKADDYQQPYRDQFHVSSRRGWTNDPNGMVFHDGKYHLYYQYNPFGISWGNMHWGHFESKDLIHWDEKPIALFQKTVRDMMFSGGGFVDANDTAGFGKNTLFVAFTSTGRGECLAYSQDGGATFTELKENPVVKHQGRDPKIIWYRAENKWVMAVYDETACPETDAIPKQKGIPKDQSNSNIAFWESKNLREWKRTGAFTDPDRLAVFECPELFELPISGQAKETRWVLFGAQNRYFLGRFDGKTFTKESGPHNDSRGAMYAAQTFSDLPDGRRIQIGWVRTEPMGKKYPNQMANQGFTLPQELTLRETASGLRVYLEPVKEVDTLRDKLLAEGTDALKACPGELSEVLIEFEKGSRHELTINGIDASFTGQRARIFTDRNFNEVYIDGGLGYTSAPRPTANAQSTECMLKKETAKSIQVYRLKSIWPTSGKPIPPK